MANTLAWHETLEIHELVAYQSNALMDLKMSMNKMGVAWVFFLR